MSLRQRTSCITFSQKLSFTDQALNLWIPRVKESFIHIMAIFRGYYTAFYILFPCICIKKRPKLNQNIDWLNPKFFCISCFKTYLLCQIKNSSRFTSQIQQETIKCTSILCVHLIHFISHRLYPVADLYEFGLSFLYLDADNFYVCDQPKKLVH